MRRLVVVAVALLVLAPAASAGLAVPPWLRLTAQRAAATLGDGTVPTRIAYIEPSSRFPRVVLTGSFVCTTCSGPYGASVPIGTVVELRYDGVTHQERDFALCKIRAACAASLCSFGRCTRTQDALDAAHEALDRRLHGVPGSPDPFIAHPGSFRCHIYYPSREGRYIVGSCATSVRLTGTSDAAVRFVERWRPREYRDGRWQRLAARSHTWLVRERDGGWRIAISSSGDAPPQLPAGVVR